MQTTTAPEITAAELNWARATRAAHPQMTPYGFTAGPDDQWGAELSAEHLAEIVIACRWLEGRPRRRNATADCISSYTAKHQVEAWARQQGYERSYVREGAVLLAAVELGVPLKRYGSEHWGAYLGLLRSGLEAY